ncbi:MAG: hypothetical protein ABR936_09075 [Bacteroidota bacterium]|jgi:hypothetical protein
MKILRKLSIPFLVLSAIVVFSLLIAYSYSCFVARINNISSILLALLTATYVVFTYKILNSARPRPLVFASLPATHENVFLSIKNIGNRPAYNVEIVFDPSLDILAPNEHYKGAAEPMLKQSFMPPETEHTNILTSPIHILNRNKDESKFKVTVRYEDADGKTFSDSYYIDLSSYIFIKHYHEVKK